MASSFSVNENPFEVQHTVQCADTLYFPQLPVSIPRQLGCGMQLFPWQHHTRAANCWLIPVGHCRERCTPAVGIGASPWQLEQPRLRKTHPVPVPRRLPGAVLSLLQLTRLKLFENIVSKETNMELFSTQHSYALSKHGRVTCLPQGNAATGNQLFPRKRGGEFLGKVPG